MSRRSPARRRRRRRRNPALNPSGFVGTAALMGAVIGLGIQGALEYQRVRDGDPVNRTERVKRLVGSTAIGTLAGGGLGFLLIDTPNEIGGLA